MSEKEVKEALDKVLVEAKKRLKLNKKLPKLILNRKINEITINIHISHPENDPHILFHVFIYYYKTEGHYMFSKFAKKHE
jgi:hypothetical protein